MGFKLRNYQWNSVVGLWEYFRNFNGHPLVVMPTGTGKSVVIAAYIRTVLEHNAHSRILVLTTVKELIDQNHATMKALWPQAPCGINSAGLGRRDIFKHIIFATIGSVFRNAGNFGHVDLILIDEADLLSPKHNTMYQTLIRALIATNPNLKVIGFTATPFRLGQGMLTDEGGLFTDVAYDLSGMEAFNELIAEGYIMPLVSKRTNNYVSTDDIKVRAGDFVNKELETAFDKREITEAIVKEIVTLGSDRHSWLIFTSGIEHTEHTTEMFQDYGINMKAIHSGNKKYPMDTATRDKNIKLMREGKIRGLVNRGVLTRGFDHRPIDLIGFLSATVSTARWVQMLGRGTRPNYAPGHDISTLEGRLAGIKASSKHDCLVLDFARNIERLGPINDPKIPNKRKGAGGREAPVKLCLEELPGGDKCNTYNHATAKVCTECGTEFKFKHNLKLEASNYDVVKGSLPIVKEFAVTNIIYTLHRKFDRPNSVKVQYICGKKTFNEFVCFEHTGLPKHKAHEWWKARSENAIPSNCKEALSVVTGVNRATHIRVWVNKKYPEILSHCFDGSNFGTEDAEEVDVPVSNLSFVIDQVASERGMACG